MKIHMSDEYWNEFCKTDITLENDMSFAGEISFEAKGFVNDEILSIVLVGKKTAIFSSLATYIADNDVLPTSGEYYVVLDRAQNPRCIIEIESVSVVPFYEVTWEMAQQDGIDSNLHEWRERMQEELEEEGDFVGFDFFPELKLVFQIFRVVHK